jgi:hypothetical protein
MLAVMAFAGACNIAPGSLPVSRVDVIGDFQASYDAGVYELLIIRGDSTYIHDFMTTDSVRFVDSGRWHLKYNDEDSTQGRLILTDFKARFPMWGPCYFSTAVVDTTPYFENLLVFKATPFHTFLERGAACPGQKYTRVR